MPHQMGNEMASCIEDCHDCHRSCLETVAHCLQKGGRHAAPEHIVLLLDCAEVCAAASGFMSRGSHHHAAVCGVCADVCDRCAESCAAMGDDETMQRCAEACRRCAESCRQIAAGRAGC